MEFVLTLLGSDIWSLILSYERKAHLLVFRNTLMQGSSTILRGIDIIKCLEKLVKESNLELFQDMLIALEETKCVPCPEGFLPSHTDSIHEKTIVKVCTSTELQKEKEQFFLLKSRLLTLRQDVFSRLFSLCHRAFSSEFKTSLLKTIDFRWDKQRCCENRFESIKHQDFKCFLHFLNLEDQEWDLPMNDID